MTREAKRAQDRAYQARKRAERRAERIALGLYRLRGAPVHPDKIDDLPPPPEVLAERDYRRDLINSMGVIDPTCSTPPVEYAANYYVRAWRIQRSMASGR